MMYSATVSEDEDSIVLDNSHAQLPLQIQSSPVVEEKQASSKESSFVSPVLPRTKTHGVKRSEIASFFKKKRKAEDPSRVKEKSTLSRSSSRTTHIEIIDVEKEERIPLNETPPQFWKLDIPSSPTLG